MPKYMLFSNQKVCYMSLHVILSLDVTLGADGVHALIRVCHCFMHMIVTDNSFPYAALQPKMPHNPHEYATLSMYNAQRLTQLT